MAWTPQHRLVLLRRPRRYKDRSALARQLRAERLRAAQTKLRPVRCRELSVVLRAARPRAKREPFLMARFQHWRSFSKVLLPEELTDEHLVSPRTQPSKSWAVNRQKDTQHLGPECPLTCKNWSW